MKRSGNVQLGAIGSVAQLLAEGWQIVLRVENLQVGDQLSPFVDQVHPPPQQIARLTHALGIGIRQREVAAAEQAGYLVGVDAIVLSLAAVDQLHVQRVAQDEGNVLLGAQVRQPVPAEHALHADHDAVAVGSDALEQCLGVARQIVVENDCAGTIENANVHGPCMQVDAGIKSVGLVVESHHGLLGLGGA